MSKSNLSADAKCFIPSKENNKNKIQFNNSIDAFNRYDRTSYTKSWYDVAVRQNVPSNQPYMYPLCNNFYPTNENAKKTSTLPTHQYDSYKPFGKDSEVISKTLNQRVEEIILQREEKQAIVNKSDEFDNLVQEGRIIVSKSSKKRKTKKKKVEQMSGDVIKGDEIDSKILDNSSQQIEKRDELTKSVRSWSEVVSRGSLYEGDNLSSKLSHVAEASKPIYPCVRMPEKKLNKTQSSVEFSKNKRATQGHNSQDHASTSWSKNASDVQPQKIKILKRNEKLEDVLKEEKVSAKKKKGKTKRAQSSDPPKKQQQTVKPVKLTDKPITLNIFEMISKSKKDGQTKEINNSSNSNSKLNKADATKRGPNFLDSTAVAKRGKEREKPKEKKPTKLKKVIIKDRMLRRSKFLQSLGLLETRSLERLNVECDLPLVVEDDTTKVEFPSHASALEHLQDVDPRVVSSLHSRRFREYCDQFVNKEINDCCVTFLKELVRFQDNQFHKDPVKARMRKRLVFGLREVLKFLGVKKIRCVIISPNVEKVQSEGGLEEKVEMIITSCQVNNIPFVFALSRRQLGFTCLKKVPVSVVGILNYDGAETHFQKLRELTECARENYKDMLSKLTDELTTLSLGDDKPNSESVEEPSCSGYNLPEDG